MTKLTYPFLFSLICFFSACDPQRVFEKNTNIDNTNWKKEDTISFDFNIPDNKLSYNLYYTVRYSNDYPYYNLFTKYYILDSAGKVIKTPKLPEDMYLFDMKSGIPYGKGLGDIFDQKISFLKSYAFPYAGNYKIKIAQYMRTQPLPGIESFGVRVEKDSSSLK